MTRKEQLEFCSICLNRKMNLQKGLLCGLTDEYAAFENTCEDFKEDEKQKEYKLTRDLNASGHQDASQSLDYKSNKTTGAIVFFVGIAILLITLGSANNLGILIIPFGAILYGARTYNKGSEQEKIMQKRESNEQDSKES